MEKKLKIAEPCHENWSKMTSVEQGRHCQICSKKVVDFTDHSKEEIIDYLGKSTGQTCGRFISGQIDFYGDKKVESFVSKTPYYRAAAASVLALLGIGANNTLAQDSEVYFEMGDVAIEEVITNNFDVKLAGTVSSLHQSSIESAKVAIYSGGKLIQSTRTDSDGNYSFDLKKNVLPNNEYTIKVFAAGFDTKIIENLKCNNPTITMNVSMDEQIMMLGMITIQHDTEEFPEIKPPLQKEFVKGRVRVVDTQPENKEVKILEDPIIEEVPSNTTIVEEVSLPQIDDAIEVTVYPNPSRSQIFVRTNKRSTYEYRVTDLNGKLIFSGTKRGDSFELNFVGKPNGTYLVSLFNNSVLLETKRVIISH